MMEIGICFILVGVVVLDTGTSTTGAGCGGGGSDMAGGGGENLRWILGLLLLLLSLL